MYRDNTLIPSEAVRLCALGTLLLGDRRYADLATEVRHFTSRLVGPSLELLGTSIELLRFEGLIEPVDSGDDVPFRITENGRRAFRDLMRSGIRAPNNDVSKLVIALKMRFMHLLDPADRREQAELMAETYEQELARLQDLRLSHGTDASYLSDWLDQDIAQTEAKRDWFRNLETGA